ncbi:hypothetical protein [Streptomyces sp. NPDC020917]|uniref:hypothetical protein n=1 Tax=Streptomyces sp. NPDC020917 TaxID=3365102 RepID=UPI00378FC9EF
MMLKNAGIGLVGWAAAVLGPVVVLRHAPDRTVVSGGAMLFVVTSISGTLGDRRRARRRAG